MSKLIQYSTIASKYDGPFGGDHPWISSGMGYIITTDSGETIAIDGGHPDDAEGFLNLIKEHSPTSIVDLWIITHPHIDHYSAFHEIATKYYEAVNIKKVCYLFPPEFVDGAGSGITDVIEKMDEAISVSGITYVEPREDEILNVGSAEIKFYFTPADFSFVYGKNPLSLIFSVTVGKTKTIFTGDTGTDIMDRVLEKYADELKCDVLQLPHHGLCDTGHSVFYKIAAPETVLIPTSKAGYFAMDREEYASAAAKTRNVEKAARRVYRSFEGTATIEC
ncbi:MAG: MBL fold metallo-hydrolase [Clostridia bacterium]|nr:MBL fold metallo-hydrolase [Clostridia bacterium]